MPTGENCYNSPRDDSGLNLVETVGNGGKGDRLKRCLRFIQQDTQGKGRETGLGISAPQG